MHTDVTKAITLVPRQGASSSTEPINMRKRIGSTVYEVRVHFNQDAKETMDEVILRIIRNEARSGKAA